MEHRKRLALVEDDSNTPNPFTDSLGILYAFSFVAVAIAGWRTGMRHVAGDLPLWAIIAALLATGCVLMHAVRWSVAMYACPLAVAWAFVALAMLGADIGNRIYPKAASLTPLANAAVLQWSGIAMTVGFGAAAVFDHFHMLLDGRLMRAATTNTHRSGAAIVSHLRASGE
ncbi:hypothetical protein G3N57_00745 [Paraburkholderia sp. Se-20369]|nr:hypothetical protein [Paraburkholderia sp. Se-20369]